jgi:hypothetical protein
MAIEILPAARPCGAALPATRTTAATMGDPTHPSRRLTIGDLYLLIYP